MIVRQRTLLTVSALLLLAVWVVAWSLQLGSTEVSLSGMIRQAWLGAPSGLDNAIFWQLRLPRVLQAFAVGGLLAMAGLLMQVLLKNPLADPYILGVSGGAGLGGVLVAVVFGGAAAAWLLPLGAGAGAVLVVLLVFGLNARTGLQSLDRLLLTGVALSSLCTAMVSLLLTFTGTDVFRGLVFWLLGELNGQSAELLLPAWGLMLLLCMPLARTLNAMTLGDDAALSLGVPVRRLRHILYWLSALATGLAVSAGGMIGFVGLVVPHVMRLLLGSDNRILLPAVALAGGVFLTAADCVARSVLAPVQLPVGVVTALLGGPVFIWLLHQSSRPLKQAQAVSLLQWLRPRVHKPADQTDEPLLSPHAANPPHVLPAGEIRRMQALIDVEALSISVAGRALCNSLDWQAAPGEIWAVIGNSGVGKSTLLRALAGLDNPWCTQTGAVSWNGMPLADIPLAQRACHLAWMAQHDHAPFSCTVQERVLAGRYPHGRAFAWESSEDLQRVAQALAQVGLVGFESRLLETLSGGERRRVSLAAALVQGTSLLMLDEPLAQLDWKHQVDLGQVFLEWMNARQGVLLWVTHDPNMALRYATHVLAVLPEGVVWQGPVREVLTASNLSRVYGCPIEAQSTEEHADAHFHFPASRA